MSVSYFIHKGTSSLTLLGDAINVIRPPLHHLAAFRQVLRVIVGSTNLVGFAMGKLAFDHVRHEAILIKNGTGSGTETVSGCARMIAHPVDRIEHGIFAHKGNGIVL